MKSTVSRRDVIAVLKHRGFENVDQAPRKYAESYRHAASGELISVKSNDHYPLVIHPEHEPRISRLLGQSGVLRGENRYFHSRALNGFPWRINKGINPEHYGIDFGFNSEAALDVFLDMLLDGEASGGLTAEEDIAGATDLPEDETERNAVIAARRGQGRFRKSLVEAWGGCAVTGCVNRALLRASHIKPWRDCNNHERLSPSNGLLLSAHLDAAFDRGLISFSGDGRMLIDGLRLSEADASVLGIHANMRLQSIAPEHQQFLTVHRKTHGFEPPSA